ncbi:MAG: baseplate J/gp47 family protein [Clostridia bacterium]|nr:baseplate J/gp47 family protein [Clostridia bacterium]
MYENQTEELIKQRMLSKAPEGINISEGDFFNDAVSPAAIELTLAYQQLDNVLRLGFAETSYGEYLDRITSERGVYRKPATKGRGIIEITAAVGSAINKGDTLATWQGNIRFTAVEAKTVGETGKVQVEFENETAGNLGNVLPNTRFISPIAIPGFISAVNPSLINAGTDAEQDDSLRERYFRKVQTPATSGNRHHYRDWAEEVAGVGGARVFPLWNGPGTVKVVIIDSNKQPVSSELIAKVQGYIDPEPRGCGEGQAPLGAVCTVVSAVGVPINIDAAINGISADAVKTAFEKALDGYLAEIAFTDVSVSYAKIGTLLMECISQAGGADYSELTVNGNDSNITVTQEQVAVRGMVNLV